MPHIHPVSDLRTKLDQLEKICRQEHEPVYLTRRGHGELVLLSMAEYEHLLSRLKKFEEMEAERETLWVQEAEARYEEIKAGKVTCRPLSAAIDDARGKLK